MADDNTPAKCRTAGQRYPAPTDSARTDDRRGALAVVGGRAELAADVDPEALTVMAEADADRPRSAAASSTPT